MRDDYDAVVVGSRVAGAPTARLLALRGHRVLMVDRASMPSDTVSTHAILRTGVLQLTRWGLVDRVAAAGTPAVSDMTLGFGEERIPFRMKDDFGIRRLYAPRRFVLDSILADAATEAGVELAERTRLVDLARDSSGTVSGVVLEREGRTRRVTARMVIGADGIRSRVADLVGATTVTRHVPANTVHYAYYTGTGFEGFWFQFTPGINAGLIATNDDAVCVFVGRPVGRMGRWRDGPEAEFRRLLGEAGADLAERVESGRRVTPYRGTRPLPGFIRRPWGPGWALVGDAGYSKDPISAHGISDALRDAELCARAVDAGLRDPSRAASSLAEYERVRDVLSWPIYQESQALADFGWDAQEASSRMRVISQTVREECAALVSLPAWPEIEAAVPA
ncbi:MAG: NAD(P)/FAD-dependent oxidoreductase [Actinomycetota bacterium]